ncbi:MAG: hypothetical protein EB084_00685 [Proteobacteria bacterium]|nr:hypothetical protein [Pseudomonadota bacterium]
MFNFWADFIQKLMRKDDSAQMAAGRLKGSVVLDRLSLSPATLDQIRNDVVRSISRYLIIDENAMTLAVQAEGRTVALAAQIPVVRQRDGGGEGMVVHETRELFRVDTAPAAEVGRRGGVMAIAEDPVEDSGEFLIRPDGSRSALSPEARARARALRRRRQSRRSGL